MVAILGWASPLSAQTITTAGANPPYNGGNGVSGNGVVTFGVENNSGADILLTDLSSYWQTASTGANTTLWASTISLGGVYFPFNAPDWTVVGTGTNLAVPAEGIQPTITGMTYLIPNGASVRFLLESDNAIRYSGTGAISPNSFTVGGISLRCGDYQMVPGQNVGYGGLFSNTGNNPRYFTGSLTFIPAAACAGQPAAGSISGPPFVCSGGSATLNVNGSTLGTGITRVWYSSPTSGGPYTTLVGTGTSVSTGPVTSTTYYVCVVTCTNSSLSDQTAEFQLPVQGAGAGGTFTIDNSLPTAGSNFNDFTDAINYLNLLSVCGPFTGTYTFNVAAGQVFNENTPVLTASGSPGNTITFQRSGVGANPVITPTGTAGTADAGITISGGDHIVFNGIDIDASAVAAVEYGYLIRNRSATDGATFNIIENCTIRLNRTNTTSRGILQTSTTTGDGATPTDFGGTNSANTYRNLTIRNCFSGIWINGGSNAFYDEGNVITTTACGIYNSIGDPNVFADIGSSTNALQAYGVQMTNQVNFAVQNCEIRNVSNTTSQLDGINITLFAGQCSVSNNIIRGITGTGTTTVAMAGMRATHSTTTGVPQPTLRVYNNVISEIHRPYTGTATATRGPRGLYFLSTSAVNTPVIEVWNNTVVIDGSANPLLSNACFEHTNPTTGTTWSVRNNIFQNNTIAQGATARHYGVVHTPSATVFGNTGSVVSNNDVFIANDLGVSGFTALSGAAPAGNRNGVAAWQTAVAQATGNLQLNALLDAGFVSSQAGLDGTGFSPAPGYLTTDLACAPRQADIGAYNIVQCTTPVAGTIAGSGAGCDGQSNILSLAGASNGLGITYQWWYGAPGGPYTNPLGTGSSQNTSALPIGSYELVADVTCSAGPTTVTTAPFALTVNAVPTASASAGAACLGGTLQLTGTTDIGTSFSWSGPNSFNSTAQNPSVNPVVAASAGTYSFTATAAGCSSTPATVLVNTVTPPAITSVTAAPNPVCIGDDTQLHCDGARLCDGRYGIQLHRHQRHGHRNPRSGR
ncbi:MAG TPA: hypothetical protein PKY96_17630 [Flavobacteriales bacterium]|nr:hypothetical protein [Flavobacteriales bacterium]